MFKDMRKRKKPQRRFQKPKERLKHEAPVKPLVPPMFLLRHIRQFWIFRF